MFTHAYKGYFIHGYFAENLCRVTGPDSIQLGFFNSYRAAQLAISRHLASSKLENS